MTLEHQTGRKNETTAHYSAVLNKDATSMKGTWRFVDPVDKKQRTGAFAFIKH